MTIVNQIKGQCRCSRAVTRLKIEGERTFRRNGYKFVYPGDERSNYDIFRCDDCLRVIDENWFPKTADAALSE